MADFRSVQTRMWREDEWFDELDIEARLFWIYLFTNPSSSPAGIFRLTMRTMSNESGVPFDRACQLMDQFGAAKKAYYNGGVVWVVNMRRLQFPDLDGSGAWQVAKKMRDDIDSIPDGNPLKAEYLRRNGYPMEVIETIGGKEVKRVSIRYGYPIDTQSVNKTETSTVTETETETSTGGRDEYRRQYEQILGMIPTASYMEMTGYMDKLTERNVSDWWGLALQATTQARVPGWHYMKACLESWLAAGKPSVNGTGGKHVNKPTSGLGFTGHAADAPRKPTAAEIEEWERWEDELAAKQAASA